MKRVSFIIVSIGLGLLTLYAMTTVLRHNSSGALLAEYGAEPYDAIDIGTLGGSSSVGKDINRAVQVVGSSTISAETGSAAFLWQTGSIAPLAGLESLSTQALAINNLGQIAGTGISGTGETAEQWPLLWAGTTVTKLETISDASATAGAINDQGLIAGNTIGKNGNHLLLWQGESLSLTIPINGGEGWANGLSNAGQMVGHIEDGQGSRFAFLWWDGAFANLGTLGGSSASANDINDATQIVGSADISGDLSSHAFLWQDGEMQDLGGLGEVFSNTSKAHSINNLGIVAGQAQVGAETHAVLWFNGQILDLNNSLPPNSEWDMLISAESINDDGWIAGTGLMDGHERAFLLQPLPTKVISFLPVIYKQEPTPAPTMTSTPTTAPTPSATPSPTPSPTPVPAEAKDMADYLIGDGRLYEVWQSRNDSQARFQTQTEETRFFHTKGNEDLAEWEELWIKDGLVYRGTDTSPGEKLYYTLYTGSERGSAWSPRYWKVGDIYKRTPRVVVFKKSDCSVVHDDQVVNYLKFKDFHKSYTFDSGITLRNVVELAWLNNLSDPTQEIYFYAEKYGLVGWQSSDGYQSYISEIHGPGDRPDNTREVIACMDKLDQTLLPDSALPPIPEWLLRRIR